MKNSVMGFVYGMALAVCGIPFTTWQFWVLMPLAAFWAVVVGREER